MMTAWPQNDQQKFACPCCGYHTLIAPPPGTYTICEVCEWEDDGVQFNDVQLRGGANAESLQEARAEFDRHEAIGRFGTRRRPLQQELPRHIWT
ncbi:MAG: hypothetical protein JNK16_13045 [Phycisphaerales bacterium]|nr:hypothetical protein [Phycisphaerales bacterium]